MHVGGAAAQATGKVSGTDSGSICFSGYFAVPETFNLGAASVTLNTVLHEFGGAHELLTDTGGAPFAPLTLLARRGDTADSATFETSAKHRPFIRVDLKKRGETLEVKLRVDNASLKAPMLCDGGVRPHTGLHNAGLSIDDGENPPVTLMPLHSWECRADGKGAVKELKLIEPLKPLSAP